MPLCLLDISILLSEPFSTSFSHVYLFSLLRCNFFSRSSTETLQPVMCSPYPLMDGRKIANLLQQGYRMPKPQHVDDKL